MSTFDAEVRKILLPEDLPPEFRHLNPDAQRELANGSVNILGNAPTIVGIPYPLAARQSQTIVPEINSLTWMRGIEPPSTEAGVPAQLRDTPASHVFSGSSCGSEQDPPHAAHRQAGVSPGNAEAEEEDWEHPSG